MRNARPAASSTLGINALKRSVTSYETFVILGSVLLHGPECLRFRRSAVTDYTP